MGEGAGEWASERESECARVEQSIANWRANEAEERAGVGVKEVVK